MLPRLLVADLIETNVLVQVLAGLVEAEHHIAVVYAERELLPTHVRAFVECLVEWAPILLRNSGARRPARARKISRKAAQK